MIIDRKKRTIYVILLISILFLYSGTVYAEYYRESKSCINGCCTESKEYSEEPYVPDQAMSQGIFPWNSHAEPIKQAPYLCIPYRQGIVADYLCAGQYHIYCFGTTGKRSYMEWILDGSCTPGMATIMGLYPQYITQWREDRCNADFDLYVYQNREPDPYTTADISDTMSSSNAYVGWIDPCNGCSYCVVVYCKRGCGYYYLTTNSYIDMCLFGGIGNEFSGDTTDMDTNTLAQQGTANQNQYDQGINPASQGDQPSQSGYQPGYGTQTGIGNQNQYDQGINPASQGDQPSQPGYQPGYGTQTGTGGQEPSNPTTAAGSTSGTQSGDELNPEEHPWTPQYPLILQPDGEDELSPGEQPWGAQYPISIAIGNESELQPGEQPWSPQYTPGPTESDNGSDELKPEEEAWGPHYIYTLPINRDGSSPPDEESSVPQYNITNITNITEHIPDVYGIKKPNFDSEVIQMSPRYFPIEKERNKGDEGKNQWYW